MNSYNLSIIGNTWLLILLFAISIGLAFFSYSRTQPALTNFFKYLLIGLRSFALVLLFFILFEPVINVVSASFKKPVVAVLLDNSKSVSFKSNRTNRFEEYKNSLSQANLNNNSDIEYYFLNFDEDTKENLNFSFDSLKFTGNLTDMSKAFDFLKSKSNEKSFHSVVLFSDGVYNAGTTPLYSAENIGLPVFTVGIGDTFAFRDISISSISTNDFAYVDNPVSVKVKFTANGYDNEKATLSISDNGNQVHKEEILITKGQSEYTIDYNFLPKVEGIRKITATLSPMNDEATNINNQASEFINILKNKRKIVLFAGYPSSDISFINQTLTKEKGLELKTFIQKVGGEFYNQPTKFDLEDAEMIIFSGFPIASTPQSVLELIKTALSAGKPLFFLAGLQTDYRKLEAFDEFLPFKTISSNQNEFTALPNFKKEGLSNPILKIDGNDNDLTLWNKLPPIFKTETYVKPKPESELLSSFKVNNVALNEPLILTRKFQNKKSIAIMGYGIYRWKLLGYASDRSNDNKESIDLFDKFLNNSMRWLSVRNDSKNVIIKTNKRNYINSEKIDFIAQVYDESMNPVNNADLKINLTSTDYSKEIKMNPISNGRYEFTLEPQKEAEYFFTGFAEINGKKLGTDNGKFFVGESPIEFMNLSMNKALLENLSSRTGGKFINSNQTSSLINEINKVKPLDKIPFTETFDLNLWNYLYLLIFAIILLTVEWLFRKRLGLI